MTIAFVTTDQHGNLTDASTLYVHRGGEEVFQAPIPPADIQPGLGGRLRGDAPMARIAHALAGAGYEPARVWWDSLRLIEDRDGGFGMWLDVQPITPQIGSRQELQALAGRLGVRRDWHEPDERGLTARVVGAQLDNAGGRIPRSNDEGEMHVILTQTDEETGETQDVAAVNLATLLAWATGFQG